MPIVSKHYIINTTVRKSSGIFFFSFFILILTIYSTNINSMATNQH